MVARDDEGNAVELGEGPPSLFPVRSARLGWTIGFCREHCGDEESTNRAMVLLNAGHHAASTAGPGYSRAP